MMAMSLGRHKYMISNWGVGVKDCGVKCPFQQYFSYIVVSVSFIGRGNRSSQRKLLACRKSLTNFIT